MKRRKRERIENEMANLEREIHKEIYSPFANFAERAK